MKHHTSPNALILKRHAMPALRHLGATDPAQIERELHKQPWDALCRAGAELRRLAGQAIDEITDETPTEEAADLERRYDALVSLADDIEHEKDLRGHLGSREPHSGVAHLGPDGRFTPAPTGRYVAGDPHGTDDAETAWALRSGETLTSWARERRGRERYPSDAGEPLSPGRWLRAMILGPKDDVEHRALAGGTDAAGGYTVPQITSAQLLDLMRANLVVGRLGARTIPLESDENVIAKLASDPSPAWRQENAAVAEGDPTFSRVVLKPKSLAVLVKASVELMQDSLNLENELPRILAAALAVELDRVALVGSGADPAPLGITGFPGLTANGFAGGPIDSWAPLLQAREALHMSNQRLSGFAMSPREESAFARLVASDGQPMRRPEALADIPLAFSTNMPTDGGAGGNEGAIIAGDWSQLLLGVRSQIRVVSLRERFADNLQFAFVAHLRADIAAAREDSFTVLSGVVPA